MFEEFRDSLQLDHIKIKRPNQVFLCGGVVASDGSPPTSARQIFLDHLKVNRPDLWPDIVLAEKIVGDQDAHGYDNLLDLEQLLADFVAAILLFVESPGSLCELGAFTTSQTILRRLIAVIEEKYREHTNSFVYLGPIRRLTKEDENRLLYAEWLKAGSSQEIDYQAAPKMFSRVELTLLKALKQNSATRFGSHSSPDTEFRHGEMMCLITGILDIFGTLTKTGIEEARQTFAELPSQLQVSRYLYILRKLGHVHRHEYSKQIWYYTNLPLVTFSFKPNSRFKSEIMWKIHYRGLYKEAMENGSSLAKHHGALKQIVPLLPQSGESS